MQVGGGSCPTCGEAGAAGVAPAYVFALGSIEPRFPSLGVEKEFAQVTGRAETVGLTDRQATQSILTQRQNRYLVRQLCWVLTIEGLETYILQPRDSADLDLLVEAYRPSPGRGDIDTVIGLRGPIAPPAMCNGLMVPIVLFSQIYSFGVDELIGSIPRPKEVDKEAFGRASEELFHRIMQIADNAGATDEHRALNFLAVRYPAIYAKTREQFTNDFSLTSVEAVPSRLSGARRIITVVFRFTKRTTQEDEQYFVRVDVSEEFPFLVTKLQRGFER